jgi:uncharacterized protein (TIGR01777 family)
MKVVAISGASGLIGAALSRALREAGMEVVPLVRGAKAANAGIAWDPENETIDAARLEGVDGIVHLAGESLAARRWTPAQKERLRSSRIRGTRLLARTLRGLARRPSVWLSASAIGYYGDCGDRAVDESAAPGDDFLASLCVDWEAATHEAEDAGSRVIHTRFGVVLDPAGGALQKLRLPFTLGVGGRIGSGKQVMSWISLRDTVRALQHLLVSELSGPVNITAPAAATNAEFTDALGRALHRPTVLPLPGFALRLAVGEMADVALLSGARVLPRRLLESGFHFEDPELSPLLARLFA